MGHLYLYDKDGKMKNRLTSGDWVVREFVYVDENDSTVYLTAGSEEKGRDPYHRYIYMVNLNGTGLQLLTPEDADHSISVAPGGNAFLDTYSRVDLPPATVLRDMNGNITLKLEAEDIGNLMAMNWAPPERFSVKALDGKTDLYGLMFMPTDFNASQKYPVVEIVYPGPWIIVTAKAFPG
jgi:dipeptidyl-peptidase-4